MIRIPRLATYGLLSTLGASAVVGSAIRSKPNFYTAAVTIGQSSGALMVLANFMLFNVICFGVGVKALFFGRLRRVEYEHLFERLWIFLTESLLAMTIFRDDFSVSFAIMFGVLVFLKCFHWITADRVDYMDQVPHPGPPLIFHLRISTILVLLATVDACLVLYALESLLYDGVSATILFASEFMILFASCGGIAARYTVGVVDIRRTRGDPDAPAWEGKGMCLFYIDLAVDFIKLLTYLAFFLAILLSYGLPLHILRDVYMTLRSFLSRVQDLIRYRRATKDMDNLYPNATHAEMQGGGGDGVCIICREEMVAIDAPSPESEGAEMSNQGEQGEVPPPQQQQRQQEQRQQRQTGPNETPKKLQCGHIFHFHCLRSWLERQQSCPTCRRDVLRPPTITHPRARNEAPFPLAAAARPAAAPAPPAPQPAQVPVAPAQASPNAAQTPAPTQQGVRPAAAPTSGPAANAIHPTVQPAQPTLRNLPNLLNTERGQGGQEAGGEGEAGEAARMREAFEQYFRFPGSGFVPTPAMPLPHIPSGDGVGGGDTDVMPAQNALGGSGVAGPSTAGNASTSTLAPTAYAISPELERHRQVQRGIWGGAIEVGRFFVPPLGAAPRFTIGEGGLGGLGYGSGFGSGDARGTMPEGSRPRAAEQATRPSDSSGEGIRWSRPEIRLPPAHQQQPSSNTADGMDVGGPVSDVGNGAFPFAQHQASASSSASAATSASVAATTSSGDRTPAYSNPPAVFRSLSESGPRPAVPIAKVASSGGQDEGAVIDEGDDEDLEIVQLSEEERRRAVAEAAAKRLGLDKGKGKAKAEEPDSGFSASAADSKFGVDEVNTSDPKGGSPYLSIPDIFGRQSSDQVQIGGGAREEEEAVGGDEEAELEMARLLSMALEQGRPLHLRHPLLAPQPHPLPTDPARRDTFPAHGLDTQDSEEVERLRGEVESLRAELISLRRSGRDRGEDVRIEEKEGPGEGEGAEGKA